ncbi:MAG: hypothetical protein JOZ52_14275 [Acidobacteria bacterium]|nr:hypothetical protein [Acidobacteriota bacterium]
MKALTLILLLCSALFFVGCSKSENSNTANANNSNATANDNAKPAASKEAAKTETTASSASIGVAACDEYFVKIKKCLDNPNVPEQVKTSFKANEETNRKAWQQAAATPQGKATLESSCQTAVKAIDAACK